MKTKNFAVFLSHAWKDKLENPAFKIVEETLKKRGFTVWVDVAGLSGGDTIRTKLESAIQKSDAVIVLWSNAAKESKDMKYEIQTAQENGIKIFPCLIEKASFEGSELEAKLYYDFVKTAKGIPFGLEKLVKDLNNMILHDSEFASENDAINELWYELSHIAHRMAEGASGNDICNSYLEPAIDKCKKILSQKSLQSAETKKQLNFFDGLIPIMKTYPFKFQDSVKNAKLKQLLENVDPKNSVSMITQWKSMMSSLMDENCYQICLKIDRVFSVKKSQNLDFFILSSYNNRGFSLTQKELAQTTQFFVETIFYVPNLLSALVQSAKANNQYEALSPILEKIVNYYDNDSDYINDGYGLSGLLDDTYLALKFVKKFDEYVQKTHGFKLLNIDLTDTLNGFVFIVRDDIIKALDDEVNSCFSTSNSNLDIWGFINLLTNTNNNQGAYSNHQSNRSYQASMMELKLQGAFGLY